MAITIVKADVKRKLMIPSSDTSYDTSIDSLISETQPALEYGIEPSYLADTGNAGLQATLKLGILEVISGEFLEQLFREAGSTEEFSIAGLTFGERNQRGADLIQQGSERLAPYAKTQAEAAVETQIASTTLDSDRTLADCSTW
ncbi:MAG: hypothetical protein Q7N50_15695 [Armatimonadota bacterium]|nr:hypothetical protein [Armatimonadota bacterium]